MKTGIGIAAFGALIVVVGIAMIFLPWHHSLGIGAVGLGAVLVIGGFVYPPVKKDVAKAGESNPTLIAKQKSDFKRMLLAIVVLVVIVVGVFYGISFLGTPSPGGASGSFSTFSFSESISIPPNGGGQSGTSTGGVSYTTRTSTSIDDLFHIQGSPNSAVNGNNATLTASYDYNSSSSITANVVINEAFTNGTVYVTGKLFDPPGRTVDPGGALPINASLDSLPAGSYLVTFYVVQVPPVGLDIPVSSNSTVAFTIP